jgi:hypothetical protein
MAMRGKIKLAAALFVGAALCLGAAWAPAEAASQADLEKKIQSLEQSLHSLKQQLAEVKTTQDQQAAVAQVAASDALPKWVQRMTLFGDTRFRYEHTTYDDLNGKSKKGKDRFRVRLRFGVKSQIHEDVQLGFRMASGSDDDPTSTNQTLGNYFAEINSWGVDMAWVTWTPSALGKMLDVSFGKLKNPFATSKAMWDGDVVPEGAFIKGTFNKKGTVQPYILASYMFVNQTTEWSDNLYAPAFQVGLNAKLNKFKFTVATSYYDWGKLGDPGYLPPHANGTPSYTEGGEDRSTNFRVWDVIAKADYKFSKKGSVGFWGHYFTNQDAKGPYEDKDKGWAAGIKAKYDKFKFGFWYKDVEANATPGFIADSDSGYVNAKGWIVSAGYKFWKYGEVELTYFNMEPSDEKVSGSMHGYQTFFTDFVFKF